MGNPAESDLIINTKKKGWERKYAEKYTFLEGENHHGLAMLLYCRTLKSLGLCSSIDLIIEDVRDTVVADPNIGSIRRIAYSCFIRTDLVGKDVPYVLSHPYEYLDGSRWEENNG